MANRYKLLHSGNGTEYLSQGLQWNSSTDVYTRLGSLYDIATSTSAGNINLPIQGDMKRCCVFDSSLIDRTGVNRVNYYINSTNPINKDGATSLLTGTTTSTTSYHLIDTNQSFISAGVLVGNYVHNITDNTYAMITNVTATDLTLGLDIITSGKTYEIGTARYDGSDGQVMVQIPKFYYKQDLSGVNKIWYISKYQLKGFILHPAFWKDGKEVDFRYMSAFEGSMFDYSANGMVSSGNITTGMYGSGDKLCSVANQWAKTNESRNSFRLMAQNRGSEWRQMDYYLLSAVQLLYLIEYANFNSQSMIGNGRTNLSGGGWSADSYIGRTGFSVKDGNNSANVSNGGTGGFMTDYMSYRGIENFYGNVWKFIDGITWDASANSSTLPIPIYVSNNSLYFKNYGSTNMQLLVNATNIGVTSEGWISNIENVVGFIPNAVGASSTTKLTDYYWQYSSNGQGWRVPFFGLSSAYGGMSGAFCLFSYDGWSFVGVSISGRLCL